MLPPAPPSLEEERVAPQPYAVVLLFVLNMLSGIFSGLNLGLMSLTVEDLNIIINSSTDKSQVRHAKRILPLRRRGNLLLCTLLIGNTVVNVMLSVLTDPIWSYLFGTGVTGQVFSLALPSALIVIFGEIVPQSVCSRYALQVGSASLPLTYLFVVATFPFAFPISLILDKILGKEISGVYTRHGLVELIRLNVESSEHYQQNDFETSDEKLLIGALQFRDHTVGDVMTPIDACYSLPIDAVLDGHTFLQILSRGHTRIPVHDGAKSNIVALLLCKDLLGVGFERSLTLASVIDSFQGGERVHRVPRSTKLNVALDKCKQKRVHMLVVTEDGADAAGPAVGIATIEDFIEEILQEEIIDETDVYIDNQRALSARLSERSTSSSRCSRSPSVVAPPAADGGDVVARAAKPRTPSSERAPRKLARLNTNRYDTTRLLKSMGAVAESPSSKRASVQRRSSTSPGGSDGAYPSLQLESTPPA